MTDWAVLQSFTCVGTPRQLSTFLHTLVEKPELVKVCNTDPDIRLPALTSDRQQRRFCWDLDGTLVTPPAVTGDYSTVKPIMRNVELVRQLYAAGHYIIIATARR